MNRIEDEFKKNFKDQELANDGFDSDGLWDVIAEDLNKDQKPKGNRNQNFLWLFFFILGATLSGLYFYNYGQQKIAQEPTTNKATKLEPDAVTLDAKPLSAHKLNTATESATTTESIPLADGELIVESATAIKNNIDVDSGTIAKKEIAFKNTTTVDKLKQQLPAKPIGQNSPVIIENNLSANELANEIGGSKDLNAVHPILFPANNDLKEETLLPRTSKKTEEAAAATARSMGAPTLLLAPLSSIDIAAVPAFNYALDRLTLNIEDSPGLFAWELSAWGGLNTIHFNYQSKNAADLATTKAQAESGDPGISLGLQLAVIKKGKYRFNTGLEYHQNWSRLDYEKRETQQVLKEDQLLKVWVDEVTGDTLNANYGNAMVNSITTRKVIHHNKYQRLSIPIEFGLQKQKQQLVFGLSAGGVFNFTFQQTGKTLDKNTEIIAFDKDSSAATFKPFSIGVRVSPFVGYCLSKKLTLKIQPQWNWLSNTTFEDIDLNLNAHQFNLNLGLGYSFH